MHISDILIQSLLFLLFVQCNAGVPCAPRSYDQDSIVCVCNSTYCDTFSATPPVPLHSVRIFQTTKAGERFQLHIASLSTSTIDLEGSTTITLNVNKTYQSIKGFGGAITDAASINIKSLSNKTEANLIHSYYGSLGIEYNIGRVPIASCDYSTRNYTYLDTPNDFNLSTFSLAEEDVEFKIPVLQIIFEISKRPISLYASPWTAPAWMKSNDDEIGRGWLKGKAGDKYHKTWAQYFVRFFEEYEKRGIKFWGVTAQNEPSNGLLVSSSWQSTGFTAEMQRDFIKSDLGPALSDSKYSYLKLMILDDQRIFLPTFANIVLADPDVAEYVSGIGVHWYWNTWGGPELLTDTHDKFPQKFILATEACNEDSPKPSLGKWSDGVAYSNDILDNLNHWATGWVDWNMALDLQGGPNWAHNYDDSPIIVNKTADEFYKQPMFYHLGHFSKFLPERSVIVHSETSSATTLKFVGAVTPSNEIVVVVLNQASEDMPVIVRAYPYNFNYTVPGDSIVTFVWDS